MPDDENVIPFPGRARNRPAEPDAAAQASVDDILGRVRSGEISAIELLEAVRGAMGGFPGVDTDGYGFGRVRPVLLKKGRKRVCFVVRLDLDNARPPIWRRLRVASDLPLDQVHDVIQAAMGWSDMHLHHFQMGPDAKDVRLVPFLTPFDVEEGETDGTLESDVRLDQVVGEPGHRLFYEYDFGDSWEHVIKVEDLIAPKSGMPQIVCLAGANACPPEDVGRCSG